MSLLILLALVAIGLILLGLIHGLKKANEAVMLFFTSCLIGYMTLLFFAAIGCIGIGIFGWLRDGAWLSFNADLVISYLSEESNIRQLLLSEVSWVGVQEISDWYLQLNFGWSFLAADVIIFSAVVGASDGT